MVNRNFNKNCNLGDTPDAEIKEYENDTILNIAPGKILTKITRKKTKNNKDSVDIYNTELHMDYCKNCPPFCKEYRAGIHLKYENILSDSNIDIKLLKQLAWNGIPNCFRSLVWKLLAGYLPLAKSQHFDIAQEKRKEYFGYVETYFKFRNSESNIQIFKQICLDIPRTYPLLPIFQKPIIHQIYEHVLYIWAVRHPASSYVQGINDLLSPFLVSALYYHFGDNFSNCDLSAISEDILHGIESDIFWLLTKLLDAIQNNYTPDQPGIQIKLKTLNVLIKHIDLKLYNTLKNNNVEYSLFSFRWFNNLFVREFPLKCVIRLWDTLLAQENGFEEFSVYVAASLLTSFSAELTQIKDFHSLLMFFQDLPTASWTEDNISVLLAQAFLYYETYLDYVVRDLTQDS